MKKIFLFFVIFLFSFGFFSAVDVNVAHSDYGTTVTASFSGDPGFDHWKNVESTINDGNVNTYYGGYCMSGGCKLSLDAELVFLNPVDLTEIYLDNVLFLPERDQDNNVKVEIKVTYFDDSISSIEYDPLSWIASTLIIVNDFNWPLTSQKRTFLGSWEKVKKINFYLPSKAPPGGRTTRSANYILEIGAIGTDSVVYLDSGLKIQVGGQEISIAAEINEADSKLKFRNNGQTYGLALIDSSSPDFGGVDDSMVRVRIDGVTYALRKFM